MTVTFDGRRCLHAAECVRGPPRVFDLRLLGLRSRRGAAHDR
ncbi:(4Fe-4S)-binding protein [Streptomyces sp. BA2]|nr:hypothetical protein [Streptomyces sp. BA2]